MSFRKRKGVLGGAPDMEHVIPLISGAFPDHFTPIFHFVQMTKVLHTPP
jgi:hypothetical protein